jgi:uncharacterized membrane protein (DUF2068 family)
VGNRSDRVVLWIGVFKLVKVAVLLAVGIGVLWLRDRDVAHHVQVWGVDPVNRYLGRVVGKAGVISPRRFEELGIGSLCYALLFAVEGVGLVMRKLWAEYLTVLITGSFLPLEVYEIVEHGGAIKVAILAANAAIVIYLIGRLRRARHWPFR